MCLYSIISLQERSQTCAHGKEKCAENIHMRRASGSVLATKYPPVSSVTCIHHVCAPSFLPNFSPCLKLPLASDKHGWRRLERAQPPRKSSGNSWRDMEEETRRVGPTPTAERGSIAFRCKKAQPRTPAIVVLLIGHRNRSGKTHKLDQLVVDWVSKSDWSGQTAALR